MLYWSPYSSDNLNIVDSITLHVCPNEKSLALLIIMLSPVWAICIKTILLKKIFRISSTITQNKISLNSRNTRTLVAKQNIS